MLAGSPYAIVLPFMSGSAATCWATFPVTRTRPVLHNALADGDRVGARDGEVARRVRG